MCRDTNIVLYRQEWRAQIFINTRAKVIHDAKRNLKIKQFSRTTWHPYHNRVESRHSQSAHHQTQ